MMQCVVTGGAGFIGSHLVDALLAVPENSVLVLDNLRRGRLANLARHGADGRLRFMTGDVRYGTEVEEALRGAEVVFHLAAQSNVMGSVTDPQYAFETNVLGTYNVLDAAVRMGVRRLVFASSREVYGDPTSLPVAETHLLSAKNTYGSSKVAAEVYCRSFTNVFGLETAILRLANVYGPRDFDRVIPLWIERAQHDEPLDLFGGDQLIDFVPVGLVVEAFIRAAGADIIGTPVNIGCGVGTPIRDLAQRILSLIGGRSELRIAPARQEEVRCYVADVRRMQTLLRLAPPLDPLEHLSELLGTTSAAGTAS